MPEVDFSKDISFPGQPRSEFVRLTSKGEKIKFRIAKPPFYLGKHWIAPKEQVPCLNVNKGLECEWCNKFEQKIENPHTKSGSYKPNVEFYYSVVNRESKKAEIFQTGISVNTVIKETAKAGVNIYGSDWQVTRNEGDNPATYYATVRLDATPLIAEEKEELKVAKDLDFTKIFKDEGQSSSIEEPSLDEGENEPEESEKPGKDKDEIPF